MPRARGAALLNRPELAETFGSAVKLGSDSRRAFRFIMRRWTVYRFVPRFFECPHCGALTASRAAKVRHRQREARIELALRELGLIEPGIDIRIYDDMRL